MLKTELPFIARKTNSKQRGTTPIHPFVLLPVAWSRLSDSGVLGALVKSTRKYESVIWPCSRFLNFMDPTISEPGKDCVALCTIALNRQNVFTRRHVCHSPFSQRPWCTLLGGRVGVPNQPCGGWFRIFSQYVKTFFFPINWHSCWPRERLYCFFWCYVSLLHD